MAAFAFPSTGGASTLIRKTLSDVSESVSHPITSPTRALGTASTRISKSFFASRLSLQKWVLDYFFLKPEVWYRTPMGNINHSGFIMSINISTEICVHPPGVSLLSDTEFVTKLWGMGFGIDAVPLMEAEFCEALSITHTDGLPASTIGQSFVRACIDLLKLLTQLPPFVPFACAALHNFAATLAIAIHPSSPALTDGRITHLVSNFATATIGQFGPALNPDLIPAASLVEPVNGATERAALAVLDFVSLALVSPGRLLREAVLRAPNPPVVAAVIVRPLRELFAVPPLSAFAARAEDTEAADGDASDVDDAEA